MKTKVIRLFSVSLALALCLLGGAAQGASLAPAKPANITYHGGEVMAGAVNVYMIWYGCWGLSTCGYTEQANTISILTDFVNTLGASPYFQINTGYPDASGQAPSDIVYGGATGDRYSRGTMLTEADLDGIVADQLAIGEFPVDSQGIYLVMTSADVTIQDNNTHFCVTCCNAHRSFDFNGTPIKSVFVGNPVRCPHRCAAQLGTTGQTPNANFTADAMANWLAHGINATVTNPYGDAWYDDANGLENSEKCEGTYGQTYTVTNPDGQLAPANIRLVNRDYLLQQNWVNAKKGSRCAMAR